MSRVWRPTALFVLLLLAIVLAGCAGGSRNTVPSGLSSQNQSVSTAAGENNFDFSVSERDSDDSYDTATATQISFGEEGARVTGSGAVADATRVTITTEGSYIVSGSCTDGSLIVDLAGEEAKAQIVLAGVNLECGSAPALLVAQADKVFITLAPNSENILGDGGGRSDLTDEGDAAISTTGGTSAGTSTGTSTTGDAADEASDSGNAADTASTSEDATLFSHDDLTINGTGSLTVSSTAHHAIVSKDDLVITGGRLMLSAGGDGIQGKDCVKITGGEITCSTGDDGIVSTETDLPYERGFVSIEGGRLDIAAADDGIKGESLVRLAGGTVVVSQSTEGLEAPLLWIEGGSASISASDDGLNAAGEARSDYHMDISGGALFVDAEGDGLDSNGSIAQSGGVVVVAGPTRQGNGALDAQQGASTSGGTLLAVDSSGMSMSYGPDSMQATLLYSLPSVQAVGTRISLVDTAGTVLFSYVSAKQFSTLAYSAAELQLSGSYSFVVGGELLGATALVSDVPTAETGEAGSNGAAKTALEISNFSRGGTLSGGEVLCSFTLTEQAAQIAANGTVSAYSGQEMMGGFGGGAPGGRGGGPGTPENPGGQGRQGGQGGVPGAPGDQGGQGEAPGGTWPTR
ncbi:MAG: carbohydrate-binding domain-containing protein [Coriobacteriales bacterium]|jgi:hypothetical protein|nr:carbohydrate-binding domain-containing protein [Coriobacteriales bacterium]